MRVLFVTSEVEPLAKSGGLADVSRALPVAFRERGVDVRILLPGYPSAMQQIKSPRVEAHLRSLLGVESAALISGYLPDSNVPVWLVHAPSLFSRVGGLYQNDDGQDWTDNALRFAFFAHVAAEIACGCLLDWKPDIVHANDWHAGLVPLLLSSRQNQKPSSIFTIHNLAFQGNFPRDVVPAIGIPESSFTAEGVEFYGQISYLKAAIRYSDLVTTVSPTYAKEVLSPEFGCGFDGVLRARGADFCGILNGIDNESWNPATDVHLAHRFNASDISGKRLCKAEFQAAFGLEVRPDVPLIGFASRIAHQKMADVVLEAVPAMIAAGAQFALVGEGDPGLETAFEELVPLYPGKIGVNIGYEEALAHRLQASADILLAPARFEPCGLTQLYAQRYGTVAIVRRTGGLADTVTDAGLAGATGFVFGEATSAGLMGCVERALTLYKEPLTWRRLQLKSMTEDFGWDASADRYIALFRQLTGIDFQALEASVPIPEKLKEFAN